MFFYILYLFCSNEDHGLKFQNYKVTDRRITFSLKGYCFSKITKIYLEINNAEENLETAFNFDETKVSVSFVIPSKVNDTFSVIITTSSFSIIKIGKFEFYTSNKETKLKPYHDLKIYCRHHFTESDLKKTEVEFLNGTEGRIFSVDYYPVIRYLLKEDDLYLDLTSIIQDENDLQEISLQNNSSQSLDLKLEIRSYEFAELVYMTILYPKTMLYSKSSFVLKIKNLSSLTDVDEFLIRLKLKDKIYFIERFVREDTQEVKYRSIFHLLFILNESNKEIFEKNMRSTLSYQKGEKRT